MPLQETSGNVTADAYGGGVAAIPNYIEDVFSTYLYTGNSGSQTINNGIDLSTKGGLVWIKNRTTAARSHELNDTARGANYYLETNNTSAQQYLSTINWSFNSNGFSQNNAYVGYNVASDNYVSWTFRKQPKFFDIVTWTHTGTNGRVINHSLGSTPGMIIIKNVTNGGSWPVWHRSAGSGQSGLYLQKIDAFSATNEITSVNSTSFTLSDSADCNGDTGATGIAYLFAHNAGGFGLTGTDNVISCGSFTSDGSGNASVTLGYEPQWVMFKSTAVTGDWYILDNMRGWNMSANDNYLLANTSGAEATYQIGNPTATGFDLNSLSNSTGYIYIAIRRGPMKVPTDATKVFAPVAYTGNSSTQTITTNFPVDLMLSQNRVGGDSTFIDRLRGFGTASNATKYLFGDLTDAEGGVTNGVLGMTNTGLNLGSWAQTNFSSQGYASWNMRRAPSFFDEVCYTEQSALYTTNHNLAALPELLIYKVRSSARDWFVLYKNPSTGLYDKNLLLNTSDAATTWYEPVTAITSTTIPAYNFVGSGTTDVAYLFATCAGVSKVFSFTGNGSTQAIACGFTGGARFVMIKATSTTGNWLIFDTARGMTTSTDPWLALNSTSAESATSGACTTTTGGFTVDESKLTGVNTNGVSYIGLAVA